MVKEGLSIDKQPVIASITMATSESRIFDWSVKQGRLDGPKSKETKTGEKADAAAIHTLEAKAKKPEETISKPSNPPPMITKTHLWPRAEGRNQWSFRGFFNFSVAFPLTSPPLLCTLGVVWGKDAFVPLPMPLSRPQYAEVASYRGDGTSKTTCVASRRLMGIRPLWTSSLWAGQSRRVRLIMTV